MKREKALRLQILREARDMKKGTGLMWHEDRVANEVALELIYEELVIGSESEHGSACITGIRDAGLDYLQNQKPHMKAFAWVRRVVYALTLLAIGYVLNLDSVKAFFSNLISKLFR